MNQFTPYRDWDQDSGIEAYSVGADSIIVRFKRGKYSEYTYTNLKAGSRHVQKMIELAGKGDGLNEYINEHVKDKYSHKK